MRSSQRCLRILKTALRLRCISMASPWALNPPIDSGVFLSPKVIDASSGGGIPLPSEPSSVSIPAGTCGYMYSSYLTPQLLSAPTPAPSSTNPVSLTLTGSLLGGKGNKQLFDVTLCGVTLCGVTLCDVTLCGVTLAILLSSRLLSNLMPVSLCYLLAMLSCFCMFPFRGTGHLCILCHRRQPSRYCAGETRFCESLHTKSQLISSDRSLPNLMYLQSVTGNATVQSVTIALPTLPAVRQGICPCLCR